jgi:hypothetical protein
VETENNLVLIVGSKPGAKFPDLDVSYIYTANGAAERAKEYLSKYSKASFASIISGREFENNIEVQKRVVSANPKELISRSDYINISNYNFCSSIKFKFYSNFKQFLFQGQFFKLNLIDVLFCEFTYMSSIKEKINFLLYTIKNFKFNGVSTGFFAILYALKFHPQSKIIITGIGMQGGGHFYNQKSTRYTNRSKVDKALMNCMKLVYKKRLFTVDSELAKTVGINFLDVKTF